MAGAVDSESVATEEGAIVLQYFNKAGATWGGVATGEGTISSQYLQRGKS